MDIALVTGAERGIGLQIARKLIELGFRVYGLSQDFSKCPFEHPEFLPVTCDLTSRAEIESAWNQIAERDTMVSVVVHAARHPVNEAVEASPLDALEFALQTELLAPVYLTRLALPSLIKFHGYVINIAWNGRGAAPGGAVNAAALGGLHHFARALFDEVRDTGVKVSTLYPEANAGEPDPKARIAMEPQSGIEPALFAQAVETVLRFKENNCISELVVRPQGTREEPKIPASVAPLVKATHGVTLPERKNFPVEPEPIPTPPRQRPFDAPDPDEDDDWDEDEEDDDELDRMLAESRRLLREKNEAARRGLERAKQKRDDRKPRGDRPQRDDQSQNDDQRNDGNRGENDGNRSENRRNDNQRGGDDQHGGDGNQDGGKKKRRRRRRGGRGRRDRDDRQDQRPDGEPRSGDDQRPEGEPRRDNDQRRENDQRPRRDNDRGDRRNDDRGDRSRDDNRGERRRDDRSGQSRDDRRRDNDQRPPREDRRDESRPPRQEAPREQIESKPASEPKPEVKSQPRPEPKADPKPSGEDAPAPKKKAAKKAVKKAAKKAVKKAAKKATKKAAKKATKKAAKKAVKKTAPSPEAAPEG
ncbi:MAG: SDR family NAD(P)-dependent oxidoreductase [Puniceicoccales bacterium]